MSIMVNQSSVTYSGQPESAGANPIPKGRQTALSMLKNLLALGLFAFLLLGVQGTLVAQEYPVIGGNIAQFKPAKQSSTLDFKSTAYRAVDGNTNGNWVTPSVMHTNLEHEAWWEVDLLDQYDISEIIIYNRTDSYSNRLSGFTISVSNEPMEGRNNGELFASEPSNLGKSKTYSGSKRGRYVKIQLNRRSDGKREYLHMAEVQVKGELVKTLPRINDNVALGKPARQSSIYNGWAEANLANDGNTAGSFHAGSVTATNADLGAWWEVDLGEVYEVSKVTIYNRTDEQSQRLSDFVIKYSDKPMHNAADGEVFQQIKDYPRIYGAYIPNGEKGTVNARYIRVALNGRRGILSLAEVQVEGKLPKVGTVLEYNFSKDYYWTYAKRESLGGTESTVTFLTSVERAAGYQLEKTSSQSNQVNAEVGGSLGVTIEGILEVSANWKVGTTFDWASSTTNTSNQSKVTGKGESEELKVPSYSTLYYFTRWEETKGRIVVDYDGVNWPYTATTDIQPTAVRVNFAYGINDEIAPELRQYEAGDPIPDEIFQKIRAHNIAYENKKNATGGAVTSTTGSNPGATSAQSGGPSTGNTSTVNVATVKEVLFHSQASLSLAEAQAIARENGWNIASSSEVEAAFTYRNLDVYAFGRMADGRFAVPVQSNHSNFQRGPNINAIGGNQGFFYTRPGTPVATGQETPQNDNGSTETSVTVVECSDDNRNIVGYFRFKDDTGKWVETDADGKTKFTYEETGKEDQAIHLYDVSRGVGICLELNRREVLYSDSNSTTPFSIYTISDAN